MLQIELEVYDEKYSGLEDLIALYCNFSKYVTWTHIYSFKIKEQSFYDFLFALYKYLNNKENWREDIDWGDIKLIFDFKNPHTVAIEVYDNYKE